MKKIWNFIPMNRYLYRICRQYVNYYNSENNSDMVSNGELQFLECVLPKCEIVFDVGANIGNWANLVKKINPECDVHCFEPSLTTFNILQSKEYPGRVIKNHFGLGSISEKKKMYIFDDAAGINSLYRREGLESYGLKAQGKEENVMIKTLDEYCQKSAIDTIDLLKLDVEGHELEVLKGGEKILGEGHIKIIQFEYGGANIDARVLLKDIMGLLYKYGFVLYKIYPKTLHKIDKYDQCLENYQYQNWVAVKCKETSFVEETYANF